MISVGAWPFQRTNVVAAFALEKMGFWPFFNATNLRFPFHCVAAVRARSRTDVGRLHGRTPLYSKYTRTVGIWFQM